MPAATLRMLSASLWDLRALCEQQLRALTDAQRLAERFQDETANRASLKAELVSDFDVVLRATALVQLSAEECAALVKHLPGAAVHPGAP